MERQVWVGEVEPQEAKFVLPKQRTEHQKPAGGLWTSSFLEGEDVCDWLHWCRDNQPDWAEPPQVAWTLEVRPEARVFRIAGLADVAELTRRYGFNPYPERDADLSFIRNWRHLRWELVAEDYDGVWLDRPEDAYWFSNHDCDEVGRWMSGWDAESTVWLRWMFGKVQFLGDLKRVKEEA